MGPGPIHPHLYVFLLVFWASDYARLNYFAKIGLVKFSNNHLNVFICV
jgi:hypothetical protein